MKRIIDLTSILVCTALVMSLLLLVLPLPSLAQPNRLARIDAGRTVALKGNVHPWARPEYDLGPVEPTRKIGYITLMLKLSADQQAALDQLLGEQQDPSSPNFHNWLTPEQYAERFGLSQSDMDLLIDWLQSHGFTVENVDPGRNWIAFSGTVEQVQKAFLTVIHRYRVDGEMHFANGIEPSIPEALQQLAVGFRGLHDFYLKSPRYPHAPANSGLPNFTPSLFDPNHYLVPGDLYTIYDIAPLYSSPGPCSGKPCDGSGQKIVIVGQSAIDLADIQGFRTTVGLPPNVPTVQLIGPDPGKTKDELEADLDIEWSGAVAPYATIYYFYAKDVFDALTYAISHNIAPVISMSFGDCEKFSLSHIGVRDQVKNTANALGITVVASSGDSGAAACDHNVPEATKGLAVNFPASVPEVTAVGGTQFLDVGMEGQYWSDANNSHNLSSAKSYIREQGWNETATAPELAASGGGKSILYPKTEAPWQQNVTPNDGARDVPDVALTAARHDGYLVFYHGFFSCLDFSSLVAGQWICLPGGSLGGVPIGAGVVSGTSASTPVFAGILALLNQYELANGFQLKVGLGNINPPLYRLFQTKPEVFHDVTIGDNMVPCTPGTPTAAGTPEALRCPPASQFGTSQFGYSAGVGYDLVTGLGSVDAFKLITQWHTLGPALTIIKSHSPQIFFVGQTNATYTLTVSNAGTTSTSGPVPVTVTDTLPPGLSYVSYTGTGWNCAVAAQTVTCTRQPIDVLPPDMSYPAITLTVKVAGSVSFCGAGPCSSNTVTLTNTAQVSGGGVPSAVAHDKTTIAVTDQITTVLSDASVEYSDIATLTATVSPAVPGTVQFSYTGKNVGTPREVKIGVDAQGAVTGSASISFGPILERPNPYPIGAVFSPQNTFLKGGPAIPKTLTVKPEAAEITLPGFTGIIQLINPGTCGSPGYPCGPITIMASIKEKSTTGEKPLDLISQAQPVTCSLFTPYFLGPYFRNPPPVTATVSVVPGTGTLSAKCMFSSVLVAAYELTITIGGDYYTAPPLQTNFVVTR